MHRKSFLYFQNDCGIFSFCIQGICNSQYIVNQAKNTHNSSFSNLIFCICNLFYARKILVSEVKRLYFQKLSDSFQGFKPSQFQLNLCSTRYCSSQGIRIEVRTCLPLPNIRNRASNTLIFYMYIC